jgi:hypothetical protein
MKVHICDQCGGKFFGGSTAKYCLDCKQIRIKETSRRTQRRAYQRQKHPQKEGALLTEP